MSGDLGKILTRLFWLLLCMLPLSAYLDTLAPVSLGPAASSAVSKPVPGGPAPEARQETAPSITAASPDAIRVVTGTAVARVETKALASGVKVSQSSRMIEKGIYTATAYCLQGQTATGSFAKMGTVGVDPRYIPLGSRLYITGYGFGIASDLGKAIKGPIIDLWMPTYSRCIAWGRKKVTVYVLPEGISEKDFLQSLPGEG